VRWQHSRRQHALATVRLTEAGRNSRYGHCFLWDLSLRMRRSEGNSPRGPLSGGEGQSRARDGGQVASTFGVVDDELQLSADNEIRQSGGGATRRRMMWHWFGMARPPIVPW
jgi:hypothetical protein